MNFRDLLQPSAQLIARKAEAKPLYIQRKLTNPEPFIAWAKEQGFPKVLSPEELHVTVVYSKEPVDWDACPDATPEFLKLRGSNDETGEEIRSVEPLGDGGAVVLKFTSNNLQRRWREWREAGASWDYRDYNPHVTITYNAPEGFDASKVVPYDGPLEFGPEIKEPINDSYTEEVVEKFEFAKILKANPYHDAEGKFTSQKEAVNAAASLPLGKDFIRTKEMGLEHSTEEIRVPNITKKLLKESPTQSLKIASIKTGQGYLVRPKLLSMLDGSDADLRKEKIVVVEQGGKHYVVDGNHRLTALKLRGETEVDAIVIPARPPKAKKLEFAEILKGDLASCDVPKKEPTNLGTGLKKKKPPVLKFAQILKRNPYHDAEGNFTTKEKAVEPTHHEGLSHVKGKGWTNAADNLDPAVAARLKALAIPPAWIDVRLSVDENAPLQATGKDTKGRLQYRYSAAHSEAAAAEKFARLEKFQQAYGDIKAKLVDAMTNSPTDDMAVLRMIQKTGIRIGSDAETGGAHKAYGATTLLGKHIKVDGDTVNLEFPGKHGQPNTRSFKDPLLAKYLSEKALGEEDRAFKTSDASVRKAMKEIAGSDFSPKDFRTFHGTAQALKALQSLPVPTTKKEENKVKSEVAKRVSEFLSNTPAVALGSYIDPGVFERHKAGHMTTKKQEEKLDETEQLVQEYVETTSFDKPAEPGPEPVEKMDFASILKGDVCLPADAKLQSQSMKSGFKKKKPDDMPSATKMDFATVLKANPYHDKEGNFTSKDKATSVIPTKGSGTDYNSMSKDELKKEKARLSALSWTDESATPKLKEVLAALKAKGTGDSINWAKAYSNLGQIQSGSRGGKPSKKVEGLDIPVKVRVF